jgi:hypothetical protein
VFIGGEWTTVSGVATTPVHNPSVGEVIAETILGMRPVAKEIGLAGSVTQG